MSVPLTKIVFRNNNGVDVTLTVEAPVGTRVSGPQTVGLNSSATINPGVNDCTSVLLAVVSDADPDEEKQTFALAAPTAGNAIFLASVDVDYSIGSFQGTITASTERQGEPKAAREKAR